MANLSEMQPAEVPRQLLAVTSLDASTLFIELAEK